MDYTCTGPETGLAILGGNAACLSHSCRGGQNDLLAIPPQNMPDTIRSLLRERKLSPLVARIHSDLRSDDPALRRMGGQALVRLGFTD